MLAVALGGMATLAEARQILIEDNPAGLAELDAAPAPGPAPAPMTGGPMLPPEIQVVRLSAPPGAVIEVLEPAPMMLPVPEDEFGTGGVTVGLQVGVGYRLRLSNLPNRPGAEIFPVIEVVGHLHRPLDIDPVRFPIRVIFGLSDLIDVVDNGRLVTHVVYLEDPDQALPVSLPKHMMPTTTVSPGEDPLRVADALGRVMAIVRIGGRTPSPGEPFGLGVASYGVGRCPLEPIGGGRCTIPVCPPMGPALPQQPLFPGDEYLCDGGDHAGKGGIGPDGRIVGVDPSDAMVRFNAGSKPRVLPTNTVCLYAPRFALVRSSLGPNENTLITVPYGAEALARQQVEAASQPPIRLTQDLSADAMRVRSRASIAQGRVPPITHVEVRVLNELSEVILLDQERRVQGAQVERIALKAVTDQKDVAPLGIKTAEGPVITGIIQGASQTIVAWRPDEMAGVEPPPALPGLAVNKEADTAVAEPGQVVTFTIRWRNMGNTPIASVSIVDSLLPRFEYVPGSARGPSGSVFTATEGHSRLLTVERGQSDEGIDFLAAENAVGSTELRWDLPGQLMPGQQGAVSFQARIR
jgi:uncharacterized repeat protein (TIGR01451 family)